MDLQGLLKKHIWPEGCHMGLRVDHLGLLEGHMGPPGGHLRPLAAGGLRSCHFCNRLITELSLLSFLCVTEVTELSILHMFLGLKLV